VITLAIVTAGKQSAKVRHCSDQDVGVTGLAEEIGSGVDAPTLARP
jgi:hypothetical protein